MPTRVRRQSTSVRATKISSLREGRRTALIVTVINSGNQAVSDLPIMVGYRTTAGADVFVNGTIGDSYFTSHLPAIEPGASLRWVVTTTHRIPAAVKLLAEIGYRPSVAVGTLQGSPDVAAADAKVAANLLSVTVHNDSDVTQYGLPLYAVADAGGRPVAAGATEITELDGDAERTVHIHLLGSTGTGVNVHVDASPTIFK
jgi:hypothetical protein